VLILPSLAILIPLSIFSFAVYFYPSKLLFTGFNQFKVIFTDSCKLVVTSSDFLLQVFFLIVIAVAIVIYLGTTRDYLSLSQFSTLAPKGDISEQGRLE